MIRDEITNRPNQIKGRGWLVTGMIVSFLGFMLPWFKLQEDTQWWYGGLDLLSDSGPSDLWIIVILYGFLALTIFLNRYVSTAGIVFILTFMLVLSTVVLISLSAVDAQRLETALAWHLGMFLLIPGFAMMLWGATLNTLYTFRLSFQETNA